MSTSSTDPAPQHKSSTEDKVAKSLASLFSLSSLSSDPFIVLNMTPELWFPLKLISALECIRKHTYDLRIVRKAAISLGLEHDPVLDSIRPTLRIERLTLTYQSSAETTETDIAQIFAEFCPVAYWKQGEKTWFVKMKSEPEAERATMELRTRGHVVGIEAENPYIYLLSQIQANYPTIQAKSPISQFFLLGLPGNVAGRHYSKSALQDILHTMKRLEMPVIMKSLSEVIPVISRKPRPFLGGKLLKVARVR